MDKVSLWLSAILMAVFALVFQDRNYVYIAQTLLCLGTAVHVKEK